MATEQLDFNVTSEIRNLLRALRQGMEMRAGFSPTDTVTMGVLCLKERNERITIASVLNYIEQRIWPTMLHDKHMTYGDANFARMRMTYTALVKPIVQALNEDDPAGALLQLDGQTNGRFAISPDAWEE
jgi:hypothetical protein